MSRGIDALIQPVSTDALIKPVDATSMLDLRRDVDRLKITKEYQDKEIAYIKDVCLELKESQANNTYKLEYTVKHNQILHNKMDETKKQVRFWGSSVCLILLGVLFESYFT